MAESPPTLHLRRAEPIATEQDKRMKTPNSISGKWSSDEARENEYMSIKVKKEKMAHGTKDMNENKFMEVDGERLNLYDEDSYSTTLTSQVMIDVVEESEKEEDDEQEVERQMMATYHYKDINKIIKKVDRWHYLEDTGQLLVKAMNATPNTYAVSFYRELEKQGKQTIKANSRTLVSKKGIEGKNKTKGKLPKILRKTNRSHQQKATATQCKQQSKTMTNYGPLEEKNRFKMK